MVPRLPILVLAILVSTEAGSSELQHSFNSPSFSGVGYSAHVLTIEQLENAARQRQRDQQAQAAAAAERARLTSPINQFVNNLQSVIYQQLAKRLSEAIFGENPSDAGTISLGGNTINYIRTGNNINLSVIDQAGSVTTITIPVGSIAF